MKRFFVSKRSMLAQLHTIDKRQTCAMPVVSLVRFKVARCLRMLFLFLFVIIRTRDYTGMVDIMDDVDASYII